MNKKKIVCLLILAVYGFAACKKQAAYTFNGDSVNKVFFNTDNYTLDGYNAFVFSITQTPVSTIGTAINAAFPVHATLSATNDVKVKYVVDTSLVTAYNKAKGTSYVAVAANLMTITTADLTIPKGQFESTDSIKVSVPLASLPQLVPNTYLIPIRLVSVNGDGNTQLSSNQGVTYIIIHSVATNVYPSPLITDMVGAIQASRTGWTGTLNVATNSGTLANMFDTSTSTYWYITPAAACTIIVNLAASHANITGIRIDSYSTSYSMNTTNVYTSTDGVAYTLQGAATFSTSSAYEYIKFYKPVTAQYIRLDVTGWKSATYVIVSDFNVYQ